jgi:hypothetical protein
VFVSYSLRKQQNLRDIQPNQVVFVGVVPVELPFNLPKNQIKLVRLIFGEVEISTWTVLIKIDTVL